MSEQQAVNEPTVADYVIKNRLQSQDETIHGWYRFVLGYPPHLVREYLSKLDADPERDWVLDPFCGTATTPVEARLRGFAVMGTDANPMALLAARVKLNWSIDLDAAQTSLEAVGKAAESFIRRAGLALYPQRPRQLSLLDARAHTTYQASSDHHLESNPLELLPDSAAKLIPSGFISPKPLARVLSIRQAIAKCAADAGIRDFLWLALASTIVSSAGNVGFGPEVYRLPPKEDADVLGDFRELVEQMIADMHRVQQLAAIKPPAAIARDDARVMASLADRPPIGIVITSPPYPNEKDYTRSTRLESVLLGFISSKEDLRAIKANLLRSNTRNVFVDDDDDQCIRDVRSVVNIAEAIEAKRLELGKTSGFERLYHRVTRFIFWRHVSAPEGTLAAPACGRAIGLRRRRPDVVFSYPHLYGKLAGRCRYEGGLSGRRYRTVAHAPRHGDENGFGRARSDSEAPLTRRERAEEEY